MKKKIEKWTSNDMLDFLKEMNKQGYTAEEVRFRNDAWQRFDTELKNKEKNIRILCSIESKTMKLYYYVPTLDQGKIDWSMWHLENLRKELNNAYLYLSRETTRLAEKYKGIFSVTIE